MASYILIGHPLFNERRIYSGAHIQKQTCTEGIRITCIWIPESYKDALNKRTCKVHDVWETKNLGVGVQKGKIQRNKRLYYRRLSDNE